VCVADAQNDAKAKLDTARANGELLHPEKGTL
jgi:hypothetical protein